MKDLGLSEAEVRRLLEQEEAQFLELKSLWDLSSDTPRPLDRRKVRETIAKYAAAFANADGGTLILGADDDGTPSGHDYPEAAIADFLLAPSRMLRPEIELTAQRLSIDGKELIVFRIPMTPEAVMVVGDGFPFRAGDTVILEPQEVINQRKEAYRRVGWEQRIRHEATLDDLDLELAVRGLAASPYRDRPLLERLQLYGLVIPKADGWGVTNAALLLFARGPIVRWHPRCGIRLFRVAGTKEELGPRRNVERLDRIEEPLVSAIPRAYDAVSAHIRKSEKLHDLFFREMPEYPAFAWQETVVNAFAHRDYAEQGRDIEVRFFEDRMEIASPGDLVSPVSLEAIRARRRVHASRNPLLVRVLVDLGLMREEGEGIPRIFEEMEGSFLRDPLFSAENARLTVTLRNEPVFEGPSVEWRRLVERTILAPSQKRALLAHPDGFTNEDYRRVNSVDRDQAYREIQELVALGVLSPASAAGRGAFYRPAPRLLEARAWLEGRLPALGEHFKESATLTNSGYRELFGVGRFTATRELARLTDEGFLIRTGTRRAARYSAGAPLRV